MPYFPKQGDIIIMDFDPQTGYEQRGRRPALVVSNNVYNQHCKLAMVCPITNTDKQHAFHIRLNTDTQTTGVILCDQIRAMDVTARNAVFSEYISDDTLDKVIELIYTFMDYV